MPKQIALVGSLVDVRNYAQSKSVRLIIEIPAEQAASVISEFGWATPVAPVSVAVARLDLAKAAPAPPAPPVAPERPKRAWGELSPAQQAGIRCSEPEFWRFAEERFRLGVRILDAVVCADFLRIELKIKSRVELLPGSEAAAQWHEIDGDYTAWLRYGATA